MCQLLKKYYGANKIVNLSTLIICKTKIVVQKEKKERNNYIKKTYNLQGEGAQNNSRLC